MRHVSYWLETGEVPTFSPLHGDRSVDVCVIGAGITGLTTAVSCARAGLSVLVLEAGEVVSGVTSATSGHLTWMPDTPLGELVAKWGAEDARRAIDANAAGIDLVERLAGEGIACDFARVPGYLYAAVPSDRPWLDRQVKAADRMKLEVTRVADVPLPFATAGGIRIERQARFHPVKYAAGLARAATAAGGIIATHTRALSVTGGSPCTVETAAGTVSAREVVLATHSPIGRILAVQARQLAYRTYVLAFRSPSPTADALFWDSGDPYNYTRLHRDVVLVGGRDHPTGQGRSLARHFEELSDWVRARWEVSELLDRWSGQVFEPSDGLPFVGYAPGERHIHVASGFSGNGLTFGSAAAIQICDAILGRENPSYDVFRPSRGKVIAGARRILHAGVDTAIGLVTRRVLSARARTLASIAPGEGKVVTLQHHRVAAYRDPQGEPHLRSARCTHLGCIVGWNDAAKTWDCPCHGGRYTCLGEVIDGPPTRPLPPLEGSASPVIAGEASARVRN